MNSYRLTTQAENEILDIFLYGIEQFELNQARFYRDDMEKCFQLLRDNPRAGRPATAIGTNIRRHEFGSHVILYEIDSSGILIVAVVHGRSVRHIKF